MLGCPGHKSRQSVSIFGRDARIAAAARRPCHSGAGVRRGRSGTKMLSLTQWRRKRAATGASSALVAAARGGVALKWILHNCRQFILQWV